jgi:hypothetical protein
VLYRPKGNAKNMPKPAPCNSVASFVAHYTDVSAIGLEVQRLITARFETNTKQELWEDARTRARMRSAGDSTAVKWLTSAPSEFQLRLADVEVVRALRHRMGVAPVDGGIKCLCGTVVTDHTFDHFHNCNSVRRDGCEARHMQVQKALARVTAEANVQCKMDYISSKAAEAHSMPNSHVRPDCVFLSLHSTGADVVSDVSICNPTADTYVHLPALGAARMVEGVKRVHYTPYVKHHRATFCAFVCESYGAFGPSMREILVRLKAKVEQNLVEASTVVYRLFAFGSWASAVMSTAIQRGNSYLIDAALRALSRGAKGRF